MLSKIWRTAIFLVVKCLKFSAFFIAFSLVSNVIYGPTREFAEIEYSQFLESFENGEYSKIVINAEQNRVFLYGNETEEKFLIKFFSAEDVQNVILEGIKNGQQVSYSISDKSGPSLVLFLCMVTGLTFLIVFMASSLEILLGIPRIHIFRSSSKSAEKKDKKQGSLTNMLYGTNFSPKPINPEEIHTRFSDVIGLERQLEEMQDIVSFLKEPEKYKEYGAVVPRGILLHGKPGTGKTLIAKAIAGEAGVPFFQISAAEIVNKYLGESEENVRRLFEEAKKVSPSIVFIDEIDSIAMQRYSENSHRYSAGLLNQLLACMDGFEDNSGVIVIAATNYIEVLDSALLRRGRFDRKIYVQEPDITARRKMIDYYLKGKKYISNSKFLKDLPSITHGFTGADFKTLLNEAAILAVRNKADSIEDEHFAEAYRKLLVGAKKSSEQETWEAQRLTAVHEAGHAVVSNALGKRPHEISIISRGSAGGYNLYGEDDGGYYSVEDIINEVTISLAGRAAEKNALGKVSTGASNDLKHASELLRRMYLVYGMGTNRDVSVVLVNNEKIDAHITNDAVSQIEAELNKCFQNAVEILKTKKEELRNLVTILLEKETLDKEEIDNFFKTGKI